MAKEIYTQDVFEKQVNGTVFQKEGRLNDFPYAGEGVFESWRYSFDAGKQIFRASNSGKVFEKRLVKDLKGNPQWMAWVEVPDAEAHGIQAIAVNDRPLQLPNSDGAIKLQITPQMIDAYTKSETYSLIDQKITEDLNKNYIYVPWCEEPGAGTFAESELRVLQITFPDGGIKEQYYLVEPHPGTSGVLEDVSFWIWDIKTTPLPHDDWIKVNAPDMKAFVTYPVLKEHTHDNYLHLSGQFEREYWNQKVDPGQMADYVSGEIQTTISGIDDRLAAKIEANRESIETHMEDINHELAPHVTVTERNNWNQAYDSAKPMPIDGNRYVSLDGNYVAAYEQIKTGSEVRKEILAAPEFVGKDGSIIKENLLTDVYNNLLENNNQIIKTRIEFSSVATSQAMIHFETDTGLESREWNSKDGEKYWEIISAPFDKLTLKTNREEQLVTFKTLRVFVYYKPITHVNFGDPEQRLQLNLIGPEYNPATKEGAVLYNGLPLDEVFSEAAHTADWGRISGDINVQRDLNLLLADVVRNKVNAADMASQLRYDVYKDSIIPSLIQQPGMTYTEEVINVGDLGYPDGVMKDSEIVSNVNQVLLKQLEKGFIPYSVDLRIEFVSSYGNEGNDPVSVYFETDNPEIDVSPKVGSAPFAWHWPGDTYKSFDKIYLRGNNAEHLDRVKLVIKCIRYGDWFLQASGHQGTIDGTNLFLNSSGIMDINTKGIYTLKTGGRDEVNNGMISLSTSGISVNNEGFLDLRIKGSNTISNGANKYESKGMLTAITSGLSIVSKDSADLTVEGAFTQVNTDAYSIKSKGIRAQSTDKFDITVSGKTTVNTGSLDIFSLGNGYIKTNDLTLDNESTTLTTKKLSQQVQGNVELMAVGGNITEMARDITISATGISTEIASTKLIRAPNVYIGKTAKEYQASGDLITLYGQDPDQRYASLVNYTSGYNHLSGAMSSNFDYLSGEIASNFDYLSGSMDVADRNLSGAIYANTTLIYTVADEAANALATEREEREFDVSGLNVRIDEVIENTPIVAAEVASGLIHEFVSDLSDSYGFATDEEVAAKYATMENVSGYYLTKEDMGKIHADEMESYDIIINNNEEFNELVDNGTFEDSARILFKTGEYKYLNGKNGPIDFAKIKYIKGEVPCTVISNEINSGDPLNFDNVIIDGLYLEVGRDIPQIWEPSGRRIKPEIASGNTNINLLSTYSIYKFTIEEDSNINFRDIQVGKEYVFYIDQGDTVKEVKFNNEFYNGDIEFRNTLENQIANRRTVIKAIGADQLGQKGFIITDVIYEVINSILSGEYVTIQVPDENRKSYLAGQSTIKDFTVKPVFGNGTSSAKPGQTFTLIAEKTNDGWTNQPANKDDYTVYIKETGTIIKSKEGGANKYDEERTFMVPTNLIPDENGIMPTIEVKYDLAPYMTEIKMNSIREAYIDSTSMKGFGEFQCHYNNASIEFEVFDDFYLYRINNSVIDYEGSLPWEFKLERRSGEENRYKTVMEITPYFYANFDFVKMIAVSDLGFNKDTQLVYGHNEIEYDCNITDRVKNDNNFGVLYDLAPITVVTGIYGNEETYIDHYLTEYTDDTHRDQKGTIEINENANSPLVINLRWPGTTNFAVTKELLVPITDAKIQLTSMSSGAPEIITLDPVRNNYVLHTGVADWNEFVAEIIWNNGGEKPTISTGTWKSSDTSKLSNGLTNLDKTTVVAKGKEVVTLTFTSDFNHQTYSILIYVHVHANSVRIKYTPPTLTSTKIIHEIEWLDERNNLIPPAKLTSVSGTYSVKAGSEEYIEIIDNTPYATNKEVFINGENKATFIFTPSDTTALKDTTLPEKPFIKLNDAECEITIHANQYRLEFQLSANVTGITPSTGSSHYGSSYKSLMVNFKPGYKLDSILTSDGFDFIAECIEPGAVISDVDGLYYAYFTMPYNNYTFVVKAKQI